MISEIFNSPILPYSKRPDCGTPNQNICLSGFFPQKTHSVNILTELNSAHYTHD